MPSIKELKETLAYSCNILAHEGHWDNILGHVSVRIPGQDRVLMKPHSFGFEEIRPPRGVHASSELNRCCGAMRTPAFGERLRGAEALQETVCAVAPVDTGRRGRPWESLPRVGDAAAMIPPFCGDGMAMALRSAEMLAPLMDGYLRSESSWHEAGRRYERAWHRERDRRLLIGRVLEQMLVRHGIAEALIGLGRGLPSVVDVVVRGTRG